MDHVVYLDHPAQELEKLLAGQKSMIIRGAAGRKLPHGRVQPADRLFFIRNNGEGLVRASGVVKEALSSEKLTEEESAHCVQVNQPKLNLSPQQIERWAGKRYLVLIEVGDVTALTPFKIDRSAYGSMDDWLPVDKIESVSILEDPPEMTV
jgi:hypothetical protein